MVRAVAIAVVLVAGCGRAPTPAEVSIPPVQQGLAVAPQGAPSAQSPEWQAEYNRQMVELMSRLARQGFTLEGGASFQPDDARSVLAGFSALERLDPQGKVRWVLPLPLSEAGIELRYTGRTWATGYSDVAKAEWQNASAASIPFPASIHARVSDAFELLESGRDFGLEEESLIARSEKRGWTFRRSRQVYDSGVEIIVALEQVIDGRRVQMELRDDDSDVEAVGGCGLIDVWVSPPAAP